MEIFSACPFAVSTLPWEPAPGRRSVCVCVKATFLLVPGGTATIAALQEPFGAEMRDVEAGPTALGDLVPFKPRADVLLAGHAYAPRGAPTDGFIARARVGPVRKALSISGDRAWVPSFDGLRPSVAVPFRRMPLRYERAVRAGENLGGVDVLGQGAELGRTLPNIAAIVDQGGETPGFGPLPLPWRARRYGLGDAALLWASRVALSAGPPPPGFDFRLFNAAPVEQQLDEIPVGVEIQLENLHPEQAWLETRLPALRIKLFRRAPRSDRAVELPMRCDTLWIDADRGICFALWRGAVLVEGPDEAAVGRLVIAAEPDGERLGPEHADRLLARLAPPVTYVDPQAAFGEAAGLSGSKPPAPVSYPPPPAVPAPASAREDAPEDPTPHPGELRRSTTLVPPEIEAPGGVALPFKQPPTGFEALPGPVAPPARHSESYPPPPPPGAHGSWPAPGGWAPPHADDGEQTPPRGYAPAPQPSRAGYASVPSAEPERTARGTLRPPAPSLAPEAEPERTERGTLRPPPLSLAPETDTEPERTARGTLRPPPPAALPAEPERTAAGTIRAPAPSAPSVPPAPLPAVPAPPLEGELSLAIYCAVKAEAWRTGAPLGEVLGQRGIEEGAFRAHARRQAEALAREAAQGHAEGAIALLEGLRAARQP